MLYFVFFQYLWFVFISDVDQVFPSDDQYSYIYAKLFSFHNHLFYDLWMKNLIVVDKNWKVQKCIINTNVGILSPIFFCVYPFSIKEDLPLVLFHILCVIYFVFYLFQYVVLYSKPVSYFNAWHCIKNQLPICQLVTNEINVGLYF